jgi:RNA polymerase sigma-70 factor (ECF subfamily)
MDKHTSLTLLERAAGGRDPEAWERLHGVYRPLLRRWLAAHLVAAQDADDVAQQVLLVVHEKLPEFRHNGRPGAFRNWLRQITVRRVLHHRRDRGRDLPRAGADDLTELADPDSPLSRLWDAEYERHVLTAAMEAARVEFTEESWRIFRLTVMEGRTVEEAAGETGVSAAAARKTRWRVLRRLRAEMDGLLDV